MRKNHSGVFEAATKHHSLINNLVKEGDQHHRKHLTDKANNYTAAELLQKIGVPKKSYLAQALDKENAGEVLSGLDYAGLNFQKQPQTKYSFVNAVAIYLDQSFSRLEESIAVNLEGDRTKYGSIVEPLLFSGQAYDDYIYQVRGGMWREDIEATSFMGLLDKAIIIINSNGVINNAQSIDSFSEDPVFVFYSGRDHYDALFQQPDFSARETLERLCWNRSAYRCD